MCKRSRSKTPSVTPKPMQDQYACASDWPRAFPLGGSTHFPNRSMMRHRSAREPLLALAAPDWAREAPAPAAEALLPRLAAEQTPWRKIHSIFLPNVGSPVLIRPISSPATTCWNCPSDTTSAGSLGILRGGLFLATGSGVETG